VAKINLDDLPGSTDRRYEVTPQQEPGHAAMLFDALREFTGTVDISPEISGIVAADCRTMATYPPDFDR
jgi:hypothetical protein